MTSEPLTAREWQRQLLATRDRYRKDKKRVWPEGEKRTCPICKKRTLYGRSDLTREIDVDGAVLVFANLHGAHCRSCDNEFLEGYEQIAIEERSKTSFRAPISGSITLLGGKKLGTYWPKDVTSAMNMHAKDALEITPLSPDTLVVRIKHAHAEESVSDP
jgi:YgiT-type zinc finger domain-containing protein